MNDQLKTRVMVVIQCKTSRIEHEERRSSRESCSAASMR